MTPKDHNAATPDLSYLAEAVMPAPVDPWANRKRKQITPIIETYKRFTVILKPLIEYPTQPKTRTVVLYSRVAMVAGQKVKIGKAEYVIKFTEPLTDSRLQLGDVVL